MNSTIKITAKILEGLKRKVCKTESNNRRVLKMEKQINVWIVYCKYRFCLITEKDRFLWSARGI
jgi:hypothetical protein